MIFKVLEKINKLGLPQVPIDDLTGYSMAITNRLDYLNHIDRFEDAKRSVKVARNSLLPGLTFEAEAKLKDQLYDSFDPNEYDSTLKLKLDLPISKISERNAYRKSIITFEKQLRTLATQLDTLRKGFEQMSAILPVRGLIITPNSRNKKTLKRTCWLPGTFTAGVSGSTYSRYY